MTTPLILVDGNAIGHAAHHATKLSVGLFQTQAIFGFIRTLRDIKAAHPDHKVIVLWDGEAHFRFDLLPNYKGKRRAVTDPAQLEDKDAYRKQVAIIKKAVDSLGVMQYIADNREADDLAGWLVEVAKSTGQKVLLVTGDSDWLQLVGPNVSWVDPRGEGKRVNHENFLEMTGYHTPMEYLQGKCLIGDSTDDIPPVGGIGKETAPVFMAQFKSVPNFWAQCDSGAHVPTKKAFVSLWKGTSPHTKEEWAAQAPAGLSDKELKAHMNAWPGQGRLNFIRNLKLMKLINAPAPEKLERSNPSFSPDTFRALCERLVFASILKDFNTFIKPFEPA